MLILLATIFIVRISKNAAFSVLRRNFLPFSYSAIIHLRIPENHFHNLDLYLYNVSSNKYRNILAVRKVGHLNNLRSTIAAHRVTRLNILIKNIKPQSIKWIAR